MLLRGLGAKHLSPSLSHIALYQYTNIHSAAAEGLRGTAAAQRGGDEMLPGCRTPAVGWVWSFRSVED